jgi:hypothetical protein
MFDGGKCFERFLWIKLKKIFLTAVWVGTRVIVAVSRKFLSSRQCHTIKCSYTPNHVCVVHRIEVLTIIFLFLSEKRVRIITDLFFLMVAYQPCNRFLVNLIGQETL